MYFNRSSIERWLVGLDHRTKGYHSAIGRWLLECGGYIAVMIACVLGSLSGEYSAIRSLGLMASWEGMRLA